MKQFTATIETKTAYRNGATLTWGKEVTVYAKTKRGAESAIKKVYGRNVVVTFID